MKYRIVEVDGRNCENEFLRHHKTVLYIEKWAEPKSYLFGLVNIKGNWRKVGLALSIDVAHEKIKRLVHGPKPKLEDKVIEYVNSDLVEGWHD